MNSFFDTQLLVDAPVLAEVTIGYEPMIDASRQIVATRLTVAPLHGGVDIQAALLLQALLEVKLTSNGRICLNAGTESVLQDLPDCQPDANLMIEVPAAIAADRRYARGLRQLREQGSSLLLQAGAPVPAEMLACFDQVVRAPDPLAGTMLGAKPADGVLPTVRTGIDSVAALAKALDAGDAAVFGWPLDASMQLVKPSKLQHELMTISELIERIDAEEPIERLEDTLRHDPKLAFHLLRYLNSATFGLRTEVATFRQAILMLGYAKLRRWLALLMVTSGEPSSACALKFAAVRRGLFMAELVRFGDDPDTASELFICGAFSLLDKMLGERFSELFRTVRVSANVRKALIEGSGPLRPFLDLARAVEACSPLAIRRGAAAISVGISEVNRSALRALASAARV